MAAFFMSEGGQMLHLTHGDIRAGHRNAAQPDLLNGVAALAGDNSGPRPAHLTAPASCAESVTDTHRATAGDRTAQR
ncbi:hypothetical protein [Micromonospora sp. S4605]|uniref:hypothetical protein n=1 Tax=Micromonospora sp. S4605 TaxID=1420897 RepID=UPI0011B3EB0C|nr:hypothetical protein [Micromonospora sp. S4605]